MAVEILEKVKEPLLGRVRVNARAGFEGVTPSRLSLRDELAKALSAKKENVIIRHVYTRYGGFSADVEAFVYDDRKLAEALEHKKLLEKHPVDDGKKEASSEDQAGAGEESGSADASADSEGNESAQESN